MEKKFNSREVAAIKRVAMNVAPLQLKKNKLVAQISSIQAEITKTQAQIDAQESFVIATTGYHTEDLVERQVLPVFNEDGTPKTDKDGRQLKATKYVLKYSDTIVPPTVEAPAEDTEVDDAPIEEIETTPAEAPFNPAEV